MTLKKLNITLLIIIFGYGVSAQVRLNGKVYDFSKYRPLEAVSVLTTAGNGTTTDSLGRFTINLRQTDSVWFSYLNKPTPKYAVKDIGNVNNFEISLHVNTTELKEIRIMPRDYRSDSIQNREDYAKAFNFQKPGLGTSLNLGPAGGVGLDIGELVHMFQFRRNKRMLAFQQRLLQEEEDRYIDHRFNRALIIRLTQLKGTELDTFVKIYRPDIEFIMTSSDYELQDYIKKSFSHFQRYEQLRKQLQGN